MGKVFCIGEALIDMICTDKGTPLQEGEHFLKKPGGAPTNVAAAIAALGGQVDLMARVGRDPFGKHLIETLRSFGAGTRWVLQDEAHFTTFAFVSLMENGERDFYFNRGADGQLSVLDAEQAELKEYDILHFGSATAFLPGPLREAYTFLLDKAIAEEKLISFDPNYRELLFGSHKQLFREQCGAFMKRADFFKVSDEEALLLTGRSSVSEAAEALSQETGAVFAITLGKEGTLLGKDGIVHLVPSITVNPVDTTGAGDAFVGAVLYQLAGFGRHRFRELGTEQWISVIGYANKAGARTCEYMGAMEAFRHLSKDIFR